ncbi:DUF932 domain-containing protein [Variovorax boronicumulans]|uniref:DUF932 domain-containing protein n=1 Tax=Variovorax boronicumulans TaxID=436515 RepID=UPI0012E4D76A|nr:DUF932 domain-containing protein [Variovorax boronicumulans]GER21412.1 DUF932 domain-containing protein [Variovorax boronicumulans]
MNRQKIPRRKEQSPYVDPMDQTLAAANLHWAILKTPVVFSPGSAEAEPPKEVGEQSVLYRSDNHQKLAIAPSGHRPWQPREVVDFYFSLASFYGLALEGVGHVQGGRKLWGLLNTGYGAALSGTRRATMHLLLSTRCDSPLAAQASAVCLLDPGGIAVPAAPSQSTTARIARSFEFLTPSDLTEIGELMRECITFSSFLEVLSRRTVSDAEIKRATAAAFGSRRGDPEVPGAKAFQAVVKSLNQQRGETTALDLLYALASLSDARDRKRLPHDFRNATWFGAGFKRKQIAIETLARILRQCMG